MSFTFICTTTENSQIDERADVVCFACQQQTNADRLIRKFSIKKWARILCCVSNHEKCITISPFPSGCVIIGLNEPRNDRSSLMNERI